MPIVVPIYYLSLDGFSLVDKKSPVRQCHGGMRDFVISMVAWGAAGASGQRTIVGETTASGVARLLSND